MNNLVHNFLSFYFLLWLFFQAKNTYLGIRQFNKDNRSQTHTLFDINLPNRHIKVKTPPKCIMKVPSQQSQNMQKESQHLVKLAKNLAITLAFYKNINFTKYQLYQNLSYLIFTRTPKLKKCLTEFSLIYLAIKLRCMASLAAGDETKNRFQEYV